MRKELFFKLLVLIWVPLVYCEAWRSFNDFETMTLNETILLFLFIVLSILLTFFLCLFRIFQWRLLFLQFLLFCFFTLIDISVAQRKRDESERIRYYHEKIHKANDQS